MKLTRTLWILNEDAVETWGKGPESWMVVEELGELQDAFAKAVRDEATKRDVIEEAADAMIVSVLAAVLVGASREQFEDMLASKMDRTRQRIVVENDLEGEARP